MSSSKPRPSDAAAATAQLLRYLKGGVKTTRDASAFLERRGVEATQIAEAIAACRRHGQLNDAASARLWAAHWARQGYARAAIARKLHDKGLDDATSTEALDRLAREETDHDRARARVAEARRRGASPQARLRLARHLAARGFDVELIDQVITESLGPPDAE